GRPDVDLQGVRRAPVRPGARRRRGDRAAAGPRPRAARRRRVGRRLLLPGRAPVRPADGGPTPMPRLNDVTIRTKLYLLVAVNAVALALVLGLAGWLLYTYRVTGPVYTRVLQAKTVTGEMEPAILYIIWPHMHIQELLGATDPAEIDRVERELRDLEDQYRAHQDHWRRELP